MYLSGIDYESIADGIGVRCVLFVSGCKHNCKGCHSLKTHDFKNGVEVTDELIKEINYEISKRSFLSGITLSGGDPMYSAKECVELLNKLDIPKNNVWIYSGFTFEEICKDPDMLSLLKKCDVLVDGMFMEDLRDITLDFRGSSNQRIININEAL